jgi:putative ABC transport system permease protein
VQTEHLYWASESVFEVFTYPLARGTPGTALQDPGSVVLSRDAAQTHFPDQNPLGKTLVLPRDTAALELTVTGVLEPLPTALHVRPDYIVPFQNIVDEDGSVGYWFHLYVQTHGSTTIGGVVDWLNEQRAARNEKSDYDRPALQAQPLLDIYLYSDLDEEIAPTGNLTYVLAFGIVGLLVLLVACINYVNLTTAQVRERMRDVGLRKTFGASRGQVAGHFLAESGLVTIVSVGIGLGLATGAVPAFNRLAPDPVSLDRLWSLEGGGLLLGVTGLTALLASAYPAAYLSGLRPAQLFRGENRGMGDRSGLRRGLVVLQFAIAIALVAVTTIVVQQTAYLADKDLGLDREHTLMVNTRFAKEQLSDAERARRLDVIEQQLRRRPDVRASGRMAYRPDSDYVFFQELSPPDSDSIGVEARMIWGTEGVSRALGLSLVAGQRLDEAPEGILLNRAAAEALGEAGQVGRQLQLRLMMKDTTTVVAGITENFNYQSLRSEITPVYMSATSLARTDDYLFVRADSGATDAVLDATREVWTEVMPGGTFDYTFMDDEFAAMHRADRQQRNLLLILAGVALLVACLGLVGLVAYVADRRRGEIGVRKTMGATVPSIIGLFTKDVLRWLGAAFVVAVPVSYLAASWWLGQFAYRVEIGPAAFLGAGLLVGVFAVAAAASQAYRAARIDPAVAMRDE